MVINFKFQKEKNLESRIKNHYSIRRSSFDIRHSIGGFTLIELLVVVTIISILFGLGYANYRNYAHRQAFRALGRQIEGDLKLAKNLANSGTKPRECEDKVLDGYRFSWNGTDARYYITAVCSPAGDSEPLAREREIDINSYDVEVSTNDFIFKTLGQGVNIAGGATFSSITLTSHPLERSLQVVVNVSGEISLLN